MILLHSAFCLCLFLLREISGLFPLPPSVLCYFIFYRDLFLKKGTKLAYKGMNTTLLVVPVEPESTLAILSDLNNLSVFFSLLGNAFHIV